MRQIEHIPVASPPPLSACHFVWTTAKNIIAITAVTVRQVLSHTTGLPNWRTAKQPLKTHFPPGEKFSYSGEAFLWLQRAVQVKTGESIDTLAQRLVFGPLRMRRSSFVWRPEFDCSR